MAIHPTAVVDSCAEIGADVEIGPYCVVGPNVKLGARCQLRSHVVINGHTTLGKANIIYPSAAIGLAPQSFKYKGGPTRLEIGAGNVIRESVTMHVGTEDGGGVTSIGDEGLFMVGAHIAHDCRIGNKVILVNGVALGGHVEIEDRAQVGGLCGVHQYVHIGTHASIGGHSAVEKNVLPYVLALGNRAHLHGLNIVGLRRAGFSKQELADVRKAYGLLFADDEPLLQQLDALEREFPKSKRVEQIISFCRTVESSPGTARRGYCQPQDART